jgi:hypothetical protein
MAEAHPIPTNPLFKDLTGMTFGCWKVISYAGQGNGYSRWNCECECGYLGVRNGNALRLNKSTCCAECGRNKGGKNNRGAPYRNPHEYRSYKSMKNRCLYECTPGYDRYGGMGIKISDEWVHSFEKFLEDMGPKPTRHHSIDRFPDKDGDYCKENCRWATMKDQSRNRSSNTTITHNGKCLCIAEWSEITGLSHSVISRRLRKGLPVNRVLDQSVRGRK